MLSKQGDLSRRFGSNGNYELSFIESVVAELESGERMSRVAFKHGLSKSTLVSWLKRHGSVEYQKSRKRVFSALIRRSVLRAIKEGRMTIGEAQSAIK